MLIPGCQASVSLHWIAAEEDPLRFRVDFAFRNSHGRPGRRDARFEIDRFVAECRSRMRPRRGPDGTFEFLTENGHGTTETVRLDPSDSSRLWFTTSYGGEDFTRFELKVTHIGRPVPASAFAFPDPDALGPEVPVTRLDGSIFSAAVYMAKAGWVKALMLANGPDVESWLLSADEKQELRRRNAEFIEKYRAALARQGFKFPPTSVAEPAIAESQKTAERVAFALRTGGLQDYDIEVLVVGGEARLSGRVADEAAKKLALRLAANIRGVTTVEDRILIDDPSHVEKKAMKFGELAEVNQRLAEAVAVALRRERIRGGDIEIETQSGRVRLQGAMPNPAEVARATEIVRGVAGVVSIENRMTVERQPPVVAKKPLAAHTEPVSTQDAD